MWFYLTTFGAPPGQQTAFVSLCIGWHPCPKGMDIHPRFSERGDRTALKMPPQA